MKDPAFQRQTAFNAVECVSKAAAHAVSENFDSVCEVRIRAEQPILIYLLNTPYYVKTDGNLIAAGANVSTNNICIVSYSEMKDSFARLCSYSVYKHTDDIGNGFITAAGGHRIGVCGEAVVEKGRVRSASNITSLNIRIAKEFIGCSESVFPSADIRTGALICGAPGTGKTTVLRDLARRLSEYGKRRVAVIDERYEIAGQRFGRAGFDVGFSDVYSGYPKGAAMIMAVRAMSPEYIICDELTGENVAEASAAFNCGVCVVASVHCADEAQAKKSRTVQSLLDTGAFGNVVFIDKYYHITEVQ